MATQRELLQQAAALHSKGDLAQAEKYYQKLLASNPNDPQALHLLGVALFQQNRLGDAVELIQRAIAFDAKTAEFHNNLGIVLDGLKKYDEAIESYRRAIGLNANYPEAHNNLGGTLLAVGRVDEAIAEYQTAITQKPDYAEAWDNYGSALRRGLRNHDAMAAYDQAIALQPNFAYAHYNRGTLALAMGQFERAWDDFEWRWHCANFGHVIRDFGKPAWNGEDLSGKTILFHSEQGLGDTIHFVRYAAILADRGARVIVEAQPALASLLIDVPGVSASIPRGQKLPDFDYQIAMMSVSRIVKTTLDTIPNDMPYILPPAIAHENWRAITRGDARAEGQKKMRVGIAWAGNPANLVDARRSIPLPMLAPLAEAPNVRFYSLQVGDAGKTATATPFPIIDHTQKLTDFTQTSGLIANLDLVISVDTVVAHLAGAMNQKVWLLSYTPGDWRWMFDRADSPWYPSMKLFRQPTPGDWSEPIARVASELKRLGEKLSKSG
jgi:Flp pilus assembly protein TadD